MRVAVDVTPSTTGATGIARYVEGLTGALRQRDDVELATFAVGRGPYPTPAGARRFPVPLRLVGRSWRHGGPPRVEHLVGRVDSVHASGPVLPSSKAATVAVVYDLVGFSHPGLHGERDVAHQQAYVAALNRADAVVAISQATADALVGRGVPGELVHVVPLGATELPPPSAPVARSRPYVLAVGAPVPRKAYADLLRALAPTEADVVIVGPAGTDDPVLEALAAELGMVDRYHRPGPVSDAELAGWYLGAAAVATPSVEEGFGLPIIEAQRAGAPVVASDIAVHREVTGGAAALVPVGDVAALGGALAEALDRGPAIEDAIRRGRTNASRYTWAACAEATLAVHRLVAG